MRSSAFALASFALGAAAQNLSIVDAIQTQPSLSNLTTYLQLFPSFLSSLQSMTNITLLAPNNDAFAAAIASDDGVASNQALVEAIFSYHVLEGTYANFSIIPAFVRTALMPGEYANVTGGQAVEAYAESDQMDSASVFYSGLLQNSTTVNGTVLNSTNNTDTPLTTEFSGGIIHIVDRFLTLPRNFTDTAIEINLRSAVGALRATNLSDPLESMADMTFFVPDNEAFQAVGGTLATSTPEELTRILQYHVVNGTVGYSTTLSNGTSLTTMNGLTLEITISEEGDIFVNSAQVLTPNVLVSNGVVHVIDNVLNPGNQTATPNAAETTQAPAYPSAAAATDTPFTSGVAEPTSSINTEGPSLFSSSVAAAASSSSDGAGPRQTGIMASAALFGGGAAAIFMNL